MEEGCLKLVGRYGVLDYRVDAMCMRDENSQVPGGGI